MTQEGTTSNPALDDGVTFLRRLTTDDAAAFAAIHRDPLNVKWTASIADMDAVQAAELIEGPIAVGWVAGNGLRFAVVEHRHGVPEVVGTCSLQDVHATGSGGSASIGIKMLPAGRGTGTAQRALELLCGYAYGNLGLEILHWRCTAGNRGSVSLAERCGFVLAAEIPGFGQLADELAPGLMFTQSSRQWIERESRLTTTVVVPVLRDSTVVLRALSMADAPALVENCRDPEAVRWTTVPLNYSMDHAEYFINSITPAGWRTGETLTFAVTRAENDELLGTVDLQCKSPGLAAIGLNFGPHARGTGAAQASVRLLIDYAFNQLNLSYLHWKALVPNWGSRKLAWKLGFSYEGQIRGAFDDRGTPADMWILTLAAGDPRSPQEPWTGPTL